VLSEKEGGGELDAELFVKPTTNTIIIIIILTYSMVQSPS